MTVLASAVGPLLLVGSTASAVFVLMYGTWTYLAPDVSGDEQPLMTPRFAVSMALIVNSRLKGSGLWLYVFALPLGISELAAGIIWFSIFTERGWLNSILGQLGILERPFIFLNPQEPFWLIFAVVLAESWRATAIVMIILVAGLQSIPRDYLEAADVFGATTWQKIRRVILPLLRPSLQVALILRTILAFQVFATVIAIAGRGRHSHAAKAAWWGDDLFCLEVREWHGGRAVTLDEPTGTGVPAPSVEHVR